MRKKYLLGAAATALALAFAAVAIASPQFKQTDKVKYTKSKSQTSSGISVFVKGEDPGAVPPGNNPRAEKLVIKFRGAKVDSNGAPQCTASQAQAANCPAKTKIGSGTAEANIVGTHPTTGQTTVTPIGTPATGRPLTVAVFNGKGRIYVLVKETGTVLKPKLSKRGTLTVNIKRDVPALPGGNQVVLTELAVKTKVKSRRVKGKKRVLIRTPKCPKSKTWKISVAFNFHDGTTDKQTLRQKCKRPKRKRR